MQQSRYPLVSDHRTNLDKDIQIIFVLFIQVRQEISQVIPVRHFACPACYIKEILNSALMPCSGLALSLCVSVPTLSQGYPKVRLSLGSRVRKREIFRLVWLRRRKFSSRFFISELLFPPVDYFCRLWCRGNLRHVCRCRNRSLCVLNFFGGDCNSSVREKEVACKPKSREISRQVGSSLFDAVIYLAWGGLK